MKVVYKTIFYNTLVDASFSFFKNVFVKVNIVITSFYRIE